jgi:hypothetical protein
MFKKGEKLSKIRKWRLLREKVEVTNQIKFLVSSRVFEENGEQVAMRGELALNTIDYV